NGKVFANTPFKRLSVQPAAGDAGGALGAAFVAWNRARDDGAGAGARMDHAYWGPAYSDEAIGAAIAALKDVASMRDCVCSRLESEALLSERTAQAIAEGQVVGWFQGRMEWGPRALGN